MAKQKADVNKSAEIQAILDKNPKASAKDIVSSLAEKGIKVSETYAYAMKAKGKAKKRKEKREKAVAASTSAGIANPVELIKDVRKLADRAGGIRHLKELVEILAG